MRLILAVLAALALPASARADDPRLLTLRYQDNVVVPITGRPGVQAAIAFGEDEHIDNVAIGDANLWQVTPNKRVNILFVKPLQPMARTNLTVVTDRHSYFFDLISGPNEPVLYLLRFTYPESRKLAAPKPEPPLTAEEKAIAHGDPAAALVDPASLDFAWRKRGKPALEPIRVFDDGRDTYLTWPDKVPLPAILIDNGKEGEGPVNFTEKDGTIIVEGVPARIVLRSGRDSATIEHIPGARAPSPAAPAPAGPQLGAAQTRKEATP